MIEPGLARIEGFIKIHDPNTGEVLVDKKNAIHYENISIAMAQALSNRLDPNGSSLGIIYSMAFGNGGSSVDPHWCDHISAPKYCGTKCRIVQ